MANPKLVFRQSIWKLIRDEVQIDVVLKPCFCSIKHCGEAASGIKRLRNNPVPISLEARISDAHKGRIILIRSKYSFNGCDFSGVAPFDKDSLVFFNFFYIGRSGEVIHFPCPSHLLADF